MKSRVLVITAIITVFSACSASTHDSSKTATKEDILQFLKVSGATNAMETTMNYMIGAMLDLTKKNIIQNNSDQVSEESINQLIDEAKAEISYEFSEAKPKFYDGIAFIYQKYLTQRDIKYLLDSYNNPTMKKLLNNQNEIMDECRKVGEAWGKEIGTKVEASLRKKWEKIPDKTH